jgi:hypothetical protein
MSNRHQEIAETLVEAFKETLSAEVRDRVTEAKFDRLKEMIAETLSRELEEVVDRISVVIKELRSEIGKPDLGL